MPYFMPACRDTHDAITIRGLSPLLIEAVKKRAARAGRSMEEEARKILGEAIADDQLELQRTWLKEMDKVRRRIFGDKVFPDSTPLIRRMRRERTRQIKPWALHARKRKK